MLFRLSFCKIEVSLSLSHMDIIMQVCRLSIPVLRRYSGLSEHAVVRPVRMRTFEIAFVLLFRLLSKFHVIHCWSEPPSESWDTTHLGWWWDRFPL